jgi:tetratricopeptide (TPR) repeat protein
MTNPRIDSFLKLLETRPADPRLHFGLALEYEKLERWDEVAHHLQHYLDGADDEGNAWGRLGAALRHMGRNDDAYEAYRRGIAAARAHKHPTMAEEFEEVLAAWEDEASP